MGKQTSIRKDTAAKLKRFAKSKIGSIGDGLGYDDIIEWLLNIGETNGRKSK